MTKSTQIRSLTITTALIGVLATSFALAGHAQDIDSFTQSTVKFGDLAVGSSQGANALYHRLVSAARGVCESLDGTDLGSKHRMDACIEKAIADAVAKIGAPALTAVHAAKNAQPLSKLRVASR